MPPHRVETTLQEDGVLVLRNLPFQRGEAVEVLVLAAVETEKLTLYPLRDQPVTLLNPTEPVAEGEWEAAR